MDVPFRKLLEHVADPNGGHNMDLLKAITSSDFFCVEIQDENITQENEVENIQDLETV